MSDVEPGPDDVFDVDRIRRLVELMEEHDLREVDLRQSPQRIRLRRGVEPNYPSPVPMAAPTAGPPTAPIPVAATARPAGTGPSSAAESSADDENITVLKSPMVGTFYARANPNVDPYVKIGDMVDLETTVCIIEAMKVFNEIPAEVRGKIVAVLADDEEPVDHGRPLFKIDTSAT